MKYIIPLFIVCFIMGGCKDAVMVNKKTNVDSIIKAGLEADTPTKRSLDSLFKMLRYRNMYAEAKFKQDSIQIVILSRGTTNKREKLWYHYDSLRVYYAKEAGKNTPK